MVSTNKNWLKKYHLLISLRGSYMSNMYLFEKGWKIEWPTAYIFVLVFTKIGFHMLLACLRYDCNWNPSQHELPIRLHEQIRNSSPLYDFCLFYNAMLKLRTSLLPYNEFMKNMNYENANEKSTTSAGFNFLYHLHILKFYTYHLI